MNDDSYKKASDLITEVFTNIDSNKMKDSLELCKGWKDILLGIVSYSSINKESTNIGQKLFDHCKLVDLKNNVLLIETDHSGWIQTLQLHSKYILNGLNKKFPKLEIKSLSFKVKGTNYQLYVNNRKKIEEKKEEETNRESFTSLEIKNDLPDELKAVFGRLKEEILTKK